MPHRKFSDARAVRREQGARQDKQHLRLASREGSERRIPIIGRVFELERLQRQPQRLRHALGRLQPFDRVLIP
jgi:hypothetical protein